MTELSLRELKRLATARELASSAFALVRERDLDEVTIDAIVDRVGYSRRTFANHFSCKQEAVVEGFFLAIDMPTGRFTPLEPPSEPVSPDDAIARVHEYVTSLLTGRDVAVVRDFVRLIHAHRSLEPYLAKTMFELHGQLRDILVDAGTPREKASLLFGAVLGVTGVVVEEFISPHPCADDGVPATSPGDLTSRTPDAPSSAAYPPLDDVALRARLDEAFTYLRRGFSDASPILTP